MPKPRLYIETTIPSFYHDLRDSEAVTFRRAATRRWWDDTAARYELVTSEIVRDELAAATSDQVPLRLARLDGITTLAFLPQVAEIARYYLHHRLMPANPPEDALHLALASYYDCDLIVTWNCRHLANPNKATHIRRLNARLGLRVPRLVTPLELLEGDSDE
jgi:predicted nucleic acid-binding protein